MAYLTEAQARSAWRAERSTLTPANKLRRTAASRDRYDIFLSHASLDNEILAGVVVTLERAGNVVYVDWADPRLDRHRVTVATAAILRECMARSDMMLYAASPNASNSKWMPWELGYFDGLKPGRVGVLPLHPSTAPRGVGSEYLDLYPRVERIGGVLKAVTAQKSRNLTEFKRYGLRVT